MCVLPAMRGAKRLARQKKIPRGLHLRSHSTRALRREGDRRRMLFLLLIALAAAAGTARAQQSESSASYSGISVQASPQIFATMCALEAAGYDVGEAGLANASPKRLALRNELLAAKGPAADALRAFYHAHALEDSAETLSPYMTFAIVAGPPPLFHVQGERESLPPGVLAIDGFESVLSAFYAEAQLDRRWAELEPQYEPLVDQYRLALARTVTIANAYLREVLRPSSGRTFTVDFEPLVGQRTNFRNFGDAYTLVVGPPSDASADAIRHAYLHFMIDPLVLRNRAPLEKRRTIVDIAARAPQLPEEYQDDIVGLLDESLIKAVELRLNHLTAEQLQGALKDTDDSGFVLVRPLLDQLRLFEKAAPAMSYYFGDLIEGIDVEDTERAQLRTLLSLSAPAPELRCRSKRNLPPEDRSASERDQWLAEGDQQGGCNGTGLPPRPVFQRVLSKYPNEPRALYGLAIADVLSGKAEDARDLFEENCFIIDSRIAGFPPEGPRPRGTGMVACVSRPHSRSVG